jgi:hypothetical protein
MDCIQDPLPGMAPVPAAVQAGGGWLAAEAELMAAVEASPSMLSVLREAAAGCLALRGTRGAFGEKFEDAVAELLTGPRAAAISAEVVAAAPVTRLGTVASVELQPVPGRKAVDLWVKFAFEDASVHRVAANLKAVTPAGTRASNDAVSLRALLWNLTEPAIDAWTAPVGKGFSSHRALVQMAAGQRKVQHGRSYWVLTAHVDGSALVSGWHAHGLVSQVDGTGRLPIARNSARESVETTGMPVAGLPEGFDVNAAIVEQLLPRKDVDVLRAQLLALLTDGSDPGQRATMARRLLAAGDAGLLQAVTEALTPRL